MDAHICLRSEEFGKLTSDVDGLKDDVETLNKIVMEGNGHEALQVSVPKLAQAVDNLNRNLTPAVNDLRTGVSGLLQFEKEQEGYHKGKRVESNRQRWLIGLLVMVLLGLLTTLIIMVS